MTDRGKEAEVMLDVEPQLIAPQSPLRSSMLALLQPLGSVVSAVFAFGVLIVATRQGQFLSIASFGAGAAVAALASVAAGGGTTLAYTTGDVNRQHAVRMVRVTIVLPVVGAATVVAAALYSSWGQLDAWAVLAGGGSTLLGVGAELDTAFLRRRLRTGSLLTVDTGNRIVAFTAIALGAPFSIAMLTGALARSLALRLLAGDDPARVGYIRLNRTVLRLAYEAKLTTLSILYSVCDRLGALVAPVVASVQVAGGYVSVLNAQQNASGILMTGLQTTLAARAEQRTRLRWASVLDIVFIGIALVGAGTMILLKQPLVTLLGLASVSGPNSYWTPVALLIPASIAARVLDFRFLLENVSRISVVSRASATAVALGAAGLAIANSKIGMLAWGMLLGEVVGLLTSIVYLVLRSRRVKWRVSRA